MEGMTHYIRLPGNYVRDREERGLECGETRTIGRQTLCIIDTPTLRDILSDADHQATGTDWDDRSGTRSAARAAEIVKAYIKRGGP